MVDQPAQTSGRRALITGFAGQDGSYLAELLIEKGYEITGMVHRPVEDSMGPSEHLRGRVELIRGELLDPASLREAILKARAHEIYHLAAPSFVPASWEDPADAIAATAGATAVILQTVRQVDPTTRVFVAASGAMFGETSQSPQREDTDCRPTNPYAIAKLATHRLVGAMREHDHLYACSGIVFNHESERRPQRFVTRRISRGAAAIALGVADELTLGNLDAVRDWSFAGDVVRGAWMMLQQEAPDDYVLASGVARTVAELARVAFQCVGLEAERHLRVDESLVRDREAATSVGDPAKARRQLGWAPRVSFEEMVERMVQADMRALRAERDDPAAAAHGEVDDPPAHDLPDGAVSGAVSGARPSATVRGREARS